MISLYVAITDWDWFDYLRARPNLSEVNFWQPGGKTVFKALQPGELFAFKLHSPQNFIVGAGVFSHATILPTSLAWDAFGEANGAASLDQMRARIRKYQKASFARGEDQRIGCRLLQQPVFLDEPFWQPVPPSWSPTIVSGKRYSTDDREGLKLWEALHAHLQQALPVGSGVAEERARYGGPTLVHPRLGQGTFRVMVTDAYRRQCSVTGERALPVLDAAHIRPYANGGDHAVQNGLLLRSDVHTLFDRGYVTVTPAYRLEVSKRIKDEFDNGKHYYDFHGKELILPRDHLQIPAKHELEWHNNNVFLG